MKVLSFVIVGVLVLLAVFTAANWSVLVQITPLSFLVFDVTGPLGLILLAITLGLVVLVVAYALMLRGTWLLESRKLNQRLQEQRELAQSAESSRFSALQTMIKEEMGRVRGTIEETANDITSHLGYIDDKLKTGSNNPDSPEPQ